MGAHTRGPCHKGTLNKSPVRVRGWALFWLAVKEFHVYYYNKEVLVFTIRVYKFICIRMYTPVMVLRWGNHIKYCIPTLW